jgi:transposase
MGPLWLESLFPKGPPKGYSTHIAVDEFLLHRGHRYATVVIDVESGDVLFCEEGKKKEQVLHFMQAMGKRWMSHVQAVSMDMNAQYDSAFREWAPHVRIVYDLFHIVKLYNDSVITLMRRRKQHELKEQDRETEYQLFKNIRFVLTASRSTLQQQDAQARENNWELQEKFLKKGLSLPPGRRLMRVGKEKRLDDLLSQNTDFAVAYILLEQLKLAFAQSDRRNLEHGMHDWMKLARQSKVPEIIKFASTIDTHLEGILNHADHPISSGKLEGTNNLIKTIRRKAYGFHDTKYFFLKIMEASRRPPAAYRPHRKMS